MLSHHLKKFTKFFLPTRKNASGINTTETNPGNIPNKNHVTRAVISQRNKTKVQVNAEDPSLMLQDWWIN